MAAGALKAQEDKAAQAPRRADLAEEFGEHTITDLPSGEFECNIEGVENVRRYTEMMEGVRKVDIARGEVVNAARPRDYAFRENGERVELPAEYCDRVARRDGLHATPGRLVGPPRGGWPVFDADGKVVG